MAIRRNSNRPSPLQRAAHGAEARLASDSPSAGTAAEEARVLVADFVGDGLVAAPVSRASAGLKAQRVDMQRRYACRRFQRLERAFGEARRTIAATGAASDSGRRSRSAARDYGVLPPAREAGEGLLAVPCQSIRLMRAAFIACSMPHCARSGQVSHVPPPAICRCRARRACAWPHLHCRIRLPAQCPVPSPPAVEAPASPAASPQHDAARIEPPRNTGSGRPRRRSSASGCPAGPRFQTSDLWQHRQVILRVDRHAAALIARRRAATARPHQRRAGLPMDCHALLAPRTGRSSRTIEAAAPERLGWT
jgi:hypothetical protein